MGQVKSTINFKQAAGEMSQRNSLGFLSSSSARQLRSPATDRFTTSSWIGGTFPNCSMPPCLYEEWKSLRLEQE
jgi:hypothetical protein